MSINMHIETVDRQATNQAFDCAKNEISSNLEVDEFYYEVDVLNFSVHDGVMVPSKVVYRSPSASDTVYKLQTVLYAKSHFEDTIAMYRVVVAKYSMDEKGQTDAGNGLFEVILKCICDTADYVNPDNSTVVDEMTRVNRLMDTKKTEIGTKWCDGFVHSSCNSAITPYTFARVVNAKYAEDDSFVYQATIDHSDVRITIVVMPAFVTTLEFLIPRMNERTVAFCDTEPLFNRSHSSKLTSEVYVWIAAKLARMLVCLAEVNACYPDLKAANVALWSDIHENMQLTFIDLDSVDHLEGRASRATYPHPYLHPKEYGDFTCEPKYVWWSLMCTLLDIDKGEDLCNFHWPKMQTRYGRSFSVETFCEVEENRLQSKLDTVLGHGLKTALWTTYEKLKSVKKSAPVRRAKSVYPDILLDNDRRDQTIRIIDDFVRQLFLSSDPVNATLDTEILKYAQPGILMEVYNEPPIDDTVKPILTETLDKTNVLYCVGRTRSPEHDIILKHWWFPGEKEHIFIPNTPHYKYGMPANKPAFQLYISEEYKYLSFENCRFGGVWEGLHVIKKYTLQELALLKASGKMDTRGEADDDVRFRTTAVLSATNNELGHYAEADPRISAESGVPYKTDSGSGRLVESNYVYRSMYIPKLSSSDPSYKYAFAHFDMHEDAATQTLARSLFFVFKSKSDESSVSVESDNI
ncbi:hypothetical protein CYMTET_55126 [Cymbomonas tetramitiformis]|uniref:Protein kinase domain-containing protein n=1 Tax=Cymbomonas tetramitiformis TaxID=36881 RepID=A0AAE0BEU3_9CHLO|nr:hypothetical protein CYMTET_55126 [Cymbomonas tetramitiformis]